MARTIIFVTEPQFLEMLERGDFLESALVYGNRYGTSQPWIENAMRSGTDILLEIDWQGAAQVRKIFLRQPAFSSFHPRWKPCSRGSQGADRTPRKSSRAASLPPARISVMWKSLIML